MSWFQVVPLVVGALGLILLPGYLIALACGAKGLARLALAAPLTVTVISLSAIVANKVGSTWSMLWLAVPTLLLVGIGISIHLLVRKRRPSHPPAHRREVLSFLNIRSLSVLVALLISGLLIAWRLKQQFGRPENVSQSYDGVFHLNAVRYILDTGSASSMVLGGMPTYGENPSFYPSAWHGVVSLFIELTNADLPVAVNVVNIATGAVVWPVGCLFLCTRITGYRPIPLLVTAVLSAGFSAFPYLLLDFGVLYPNFLSVAILPACVGLAAMVLKLSADNHQPWVVSALGFAGTIPGLALAHPSSLMVLAAFFLPLGGVAVIRLWRQLSHRSARFYKYIPSLAALAAYTAIVVVLWQELRPSEASSQWEPTQTSAQAVGEVLTSAPMGAPAAWTIMFLTLAGILHVVLRRGTWWAAGVFLVTAFLFIVVSGTPKGDFRTLITGVWYNDSFRLAALLPVTTIILAAVGGSWILTVLVQKLLQRGPRIVLQERGYRLEATWPAVIVTACTLAALVPLTQGKSISLPVTKAHTKNYALNAESALLSTDERKLIEELPEFLPEGSVLAGNAWTGTAYAYALSGYRVLTPHLGTTGEPENLELLMTLDQVASNPSVCSLLDTTGVNYVLEFPGEELHAGDHYYPGVEDLANVPGLELVRSEGEAALYEITACAN